MEVKFAKAAAWSQLVLDMGTEELAYKFYLSAARFYHNFELELCNLYEKNLGKQLNFDIEDLFIYLVKN